LDFSQKKEKKHQEPDLINLSPSVTSIHPWSLPALQEVACKLLVIPCLLTSCFTFLSAPAQLPAISSGALAKLLLALKVVIESKPKPNLGRNVN